MNKNFYKNLGLNIKRLRKERNLTQQQLAEKVGKGLNFVGKIEVAFSKPHIDTLIDIANALEVSVSELTNFKH